MIFDVEQHIRLKRVGAIAAAPCGTWLAVAVQRLDREGSKYVSDLWRVPTDGSAAVQLTRGDCKDASPCFRQDGALGFLSNRSPNEFKADEAAEERMQVWLLPACGGEPRQLTDEPLGVSAFRFAASASRLVLLAPVLPGVAQDQQRETAKQQEKHGSSARHFRCQPVRFWDEWLHENEHMPSTHLLAYADDGSQRQDLTPEARRDFSIEPEFDVSADGRWVVVTQLTPAEDRIQDSRLLVIDLDNAAQRAISAGDRSHLSSPKFSPDGQNIAAIGYFRSHQSAPQPQLMVIGTQGTQDNQESQGQQSAERRVLAAAWDRQAMQPVWATSGQQIYLTADDQGHTPIFAFDLVSDQVTRLTARQAGGGHSEVTPLADGRLACVRSTLLDAPECYVLPAQPDSLPVPLARLSGFAPADDWAAVENFTVASSDGVPIQSFLVKPKGAALPEAGSAALPLQFWIHGGPMAMDQDAWHWRWNPLLMVAQGYAVALPNPRGSTGFGQDFVQGIWGNVWGGQCYEDLMAVSDHLATRADIDARRMMAMGGSFGGYMTNWIGTQTDRYRCLVSHAGIMTMAQFAGATDVPGWCYLEMAGENPYTDREHYDRYAPIRYVSQWRTPTLVIHGEKDYRCPHHEGLMLFEALQYHGVPSELLIFPDENHWIRWPRNVVSWYETIIGFIARHMPAA